MENNKSKMDTYGKKTVLEELRRNFDKAYSSVDILDGKLQNILSLSSLLVALVGLININNLKSNLECWFLVWFITLSALYLAIFITIFLALRPRDFQNPISRSWDELDKRYFNEMDEKVLDRLNSDYLTFIEKINRVSKEKAKSLNTVLIYVFLVVVIILISLPFGV